MALGLLGLESRHDAGLRRQGRAGPGHGAASRPVPGAAGARQERDGYDAVQLGFLDKARRKATRPERGHVSADLESKRRRARAAAGVALPPKANCEPQRYIREFRLDRPPRELTVGKRADGAAEVFKDVKARGRDRHQQGPRHRPASMKRHNFGGLRGSHGVKKRNRAPGSIGSHASNRGSGRPKKGIRMAGRYGGERVTVRNLDVVRIDAENHLMLVEGAVPGPNGGLVMVRPTNKKDQPDRRRKLERSCAKKARR